MRSFPERKSILFFVAGLCLGGLAAFGLNRMGEGRHAHAGTTLATVGDERITVEEFSRMAELRSGTRGASIDKKALLDEMIFHKALVARARAEGIEAEASFRHGVENLLVGKIREKHQRAEVAPTESEIRGWYEKTIERYMQGERRRLAMIFVETTGQGGDAEGASANKTRLEEVRKEVTSAEDDKKAAHIWTQAAAQMSSDRASRYRGGEIGWFESGTEYRMDPAVMAAGYDLDQPGDVSGVVETKGGLYVVRLLEWKPAGARPFESVEAEVRHRLILERQKEAEAAFRKEAFDAVEVEIREKVFEGIETPDLEKEGAAFPLGGL